MGNLRATELRIGNLVYISDNYTLAFYKQETQINIHNMMYLCGETKEPLDFTFEPIPLTEEWLLKFGFELYNNYYHTYFDTYKAEIRVKRNGNGFAIRLKRNNSMVWVCNVEYVHSLQNLVHALTNEELTIKN